MPTPPLPLATAITRQSAGRRITPSRSGAPPRSFCVSACRSSGVITSKESSTPVDARARRPEPAPPAAGTSRAAGSRRTVRTIVNATTPSWISTSRTMSSSVTGRRSSGSITCSRAFRTASRETSTRRMYRLRPGLRRLEPAAGRAPDPPARHGLAERTSEPSGSPASRADDAEELFPGDRPALVDRLPDRLDLVLEPAGAVAAAATCRTCPGSSTDTASRARAGSACGPRARVPGSPRLPPP